MTTNRNVQIWNSSSNKWENNEIQRVNATYDATVTTIALTQNTWTQVQKTLTLTQNKGFSSTTSGILTYTGTGTKLFNVIFNVQGNITTNSRQWIIKLYKGATAIDESISYLTGRNAGQYDNNSNSLLVELAQNDTLSVYIMNPANNNDFDIVNLSFKIYEIIKI